MASKQFLKMQWYGKTHSTDLGKPLAMHADHSARLRRQPILYGAQQGYLYKEQFAFKEMKQTKPLSSLQR